MKKIILIIALVLLLDIVLVSSHENFEEAKKLVDAKVSCDKLTAEQLEEVGDYLMELMHPGEAHERMHEMMGGEESDAVKQMHVNMTRMMYCGESGGMMGSGMMGMNSMMMNNMMGGNMNGMFGYGYGLTTWGWIWMIFWFLFWILILVGIVLLVIWLIRGITRTGTAQSESALDILKKRYAAGEITKKEFEEMKKELGE